MQNELNTSLIEAVKEKLPLKENLANLLIDTFTAGHLVPADFQLFII